MNIDDGCQEKVLSNGNNRSGGDWLISKYSLQLNGNHILRLLKEFLLSITYKLSMYDYF